MVRAPDSPDMPPYDLRDRTLAFAVDVVRWCAKNNKGAVMEPLVKQLVRSGTGVGANYRSARRGRSRREFVARLAIAHEEADEAVYWLTVIITALLSDDATAAQLLDEAEDAIRNNNQGRTAAAIAIYGEGGHSPDAVYDRMLRYTISEDGRLHGEKYFQTVQEEFKTTRPAFRWRQLVALARVTASEFGYPAPGFKESCELLGVA